VLETENAYLATQVAAQTTSMPGQDIEATVETLATRNAYLATRVAAQAVPTPGQDIEATLAALATQNAHLATQVAAQYTPVRPTLTPELGQIPTPYCRPSEAAVNLSASATVLKVGQIVSVTVTLANGDTSDVRLGLIQYSLRVRPSGILTSDNLGPVDHPVSINPGQSDEVEFVLRTAAPGLATFTGVTSFEIHPMDYSWGSWSGCESEPLEIRVTP
jgi:hypothetical protein